MYFPTNMNFQYFFFDTYIGYFLQALPIAILVGIIYGIIKYKNDRDTKLIRKIFSCLFVSYITGLICLTLGLRIMSNIWYFLFYHMESGNNIIFFEFEYNLIPNFFKHINDEAIGNFLMFIPFGILYPLTKEKINMKKTILNGSILILIVELLQPIFGRAFDINDIILNILGITFSSCIFFIIKHFLNTNKK